MRRTHKRLLAEVRKRGLSGAVWAMLVILERIHGMEYALRAVRRWPEPPRQRAPVSAGGEGRRMGYYRVSLENYIEGEYENEEDAKRAFMEFLEDESSEHLTVEEFKDGEWQ